MFERFAIIVSLGAIGASALDHDIVSRG